MPRAPGGCRTPPRRCRRSSSATCVAAASRICARRRVARPPSSRPRAPARVAAAPRANAVPRGPGRPQRRRQTPARLHLTAETVAVDVTQWRAGPFDAVLLDAPCSSTGTIRRHPDIPWFKRAADIPALAALQRRLVAQASELTKPGAILIYCTCSLEPEEGVDVIRDLLDHNPSLRRQPISAAEVHGRPEWLTADGDLRTLPCHLPDPDSRMGGLDGFYAARLQRI